MFIYVYSMPGDQQIIDRSVLGVEKGMRFSAGLSVLFDLLSYNQNYAKAILLVRKVNPNGNK